MTKRRAALLTMVTLGAVLAWVVSSQSTPEPGAGTGAAARRGVRPAASHRPRGAAESAAVARARRARSDADQPDSDEPVAGEPATDDPGVVVDARVAAAMRGSVAVMLRECIRANQRTEHDGARLLVSFVGRPSDDHLVAEAIEVRLVPSGDETLAPCVAEKLRSARLSAALAPGGETPVPFAFSFVVR